MASRTLTGIYGTVAVTVDAYTLINLGSFSGGTVSSGLTVSGTGDTVVNAGSISGTGEAVNASQGLSLTNQSSGVINIVLGGFGVNVAGGAGTIVNAGVIAGGHVGVNLLAGGIVTNQASGVIKDGGTSSFGIAIVGGAATVSNAGVVNAGGDGVYAADGLSLTNLTTGAITGANRFGIYVQGAAGSVTNAGGISGKSDGIVLAVGGSVTNQGGGRIASGATGSFGIAVNGSAGTVVNDGVISGELTGVELLTDGAVTNQAGGTITGVARAGVVIAGNAGTLVNGGTIEGGYGTAVTLVGSGGLVVVDPGAVFTGVVNGGTGANTLELASGSGIGTLSGLGTQYLGFTAINVDPGAYWYLGGTGVLTAALTLTNAGTITSTSDGVVLAASGAVTNQSSGTIVSGTIAISIAGAAPAMVSNAGSIFGRIAGVQIQSDASVDNTGLVRATLYGITIGGAGTVTNAGTIIGYAGGAILINAGGNVDNVGRISGYRGVYIVGGVGTVTNSGTILGANTGPEGAGVSLGSGGIVDNTAGLIEGIRRGVYITGGGTVLNAGVIEAAGTASIYFLNYETGGGVYILGGIGTITNSGTILAAGPDGDGVRLETGGGIDNTAGLITGERDGVSLKGGIGTVENVATIIGTHGDGIELLAGGGVDNDGGLIEGARYGVYIKSSPATVTNTGTIGWSGAPSGPGTTAFVTQLQAGVELYSGGGVDNIAGLIQGVVIGGTGTVINAGTIESPGTTPSYGVRIVGENTSSTGLVVNSGLIQSIGYGVELRSYISTNATIGTIVNSGTIEATGFGHSGITTHGIGNYGAGVGLNAGSLDNTGLIQGSDGVDIFTDVLYGSYGGTGTVTNEGTIIGVGTGAHNGSVLLVAGGSVSNSGFIRGDGGLGGVYLRGSLGAVTNGGTIIGTHGTGVTIYTGLVDPGTIHRVDNSGLIQGYRDGVFIERFSLGAYVSTPGSVVNSGTIEASVGNAIDIVNLVGDVTNAGTASLIEAARGVFIGGTGTVANAGTIVGTNLDGITILGIGNVTNATGALIQGATIGIGLGGAGIVGNAGAIEGTDYGIKAHDGLSLTNLVGGTIVGTGNRGILVQTATGTVSNAGAIIGRNDGVVLAAGGTVTNQTGGTISGIFNDAIGILGVAGKVVNAGAITAYYGGVLLNDGGGVTNQGSGTISSTHGRAVLVEAAGTVLNAGGIAGYTYGVLLRDGGSVTNQGTGWITSTAGDGIALQGAAATVTNAGTISGDTDAVLFGVGFSNRLIVDPGEVFFGMVDGGNAVGATVASTLELASAAAAGTLSGIGSQYIDFATIAVDAGATWALTGMNTFSAGMTLTNAGMLTAANLVGAGNAVIQAGATLDVLGAITGGETIEFSGATGLLALASPADVAGSVTGLAAGDAIDLAGVDPASISLASGVLHFTSGGTAESFNLVSDSGAVTAVTDNNGGALVSALCFCAGTRIATPTGEVPVERLSHGDLVLTATGAARPLVWVGTGKVVVRRGRRTAATPVIVCKGALAANVPNRDLRVTKGHSLLIDGVLIPVEFLVNHRSIRWDDHAREVAIYHLELETHDVLVANGALAESYRDDGNRWLFDNANTGWAQPPKPPCAPVLTGGPIVDAAWRRLLDHAPPRPGVPLTDDPDLHLRVDGQRVDGVWHSKNRCAFKVPRPLAEIRVASNAGSPAELGLARDPRVLGVAIRQIRIWQGTRLRVIEASDAALTEGFHAFEEDSGFRWTDGDALLPGSLMGGIGRPCHVELLVESTARYPLLRDAA